MTDPKAQEEMAPPPKPPRPSQQPTSTTQRQLDADEMYARQLSEHYNATGRRAPPPAGKATQDTSDLEEAKSRMTGNTAFSMVRSVVTVRCAYANCGSLQMIYP